MPSTVTGSAELRARRAQGVDQTALGQPGGQAAACERAHLLQRLVDLGAEAAQELGLRGVEDRGALGRQPELDPQRDQALLGAVVQVVLDPPALVLGRGLGRARAPRAPRSGAARSATRAARCRASSAT